MSELPKKYDPKLVENKWYEFWKNGGFFKADPTSEKPPYCIVLPPPNVTGVLHMGHALVNTLQDIMIRYKKMTGFETLWIPGTDHAGISTQTVVERHLYAKTGKRKVEFDREEFLGHIWEWKERHQETILSQLEKVGCALDWSRLRFTMDEQSTKAVRTMFKKMYEDGLIYRGDYLVNWDPVLQTAIADDEVEYEERQSCLWHFRYPIEDSEECIVIATTRPETMLGDVAVAVAPGDARYEHLVGKYLVLPIVGRRIPIIADHYVDKDFGSGAVKITPAHDFNDYEVGSRNDLPLINIMNPDGTLNEEAKEYEHMTMEEARPKVVQHMRNLGLVEKIEPHTHRVGLSYRSKAVIEPYLSKQWFVKMSSFKDALLLSVKEDRLKIIPDSWEKTYFHWINNLRDWCISRQLWWGHRIPIWYNKTSGEIICFEGEGEPEPVQENPEAWQQDEDVLDTWFSSALWPMTTLGWPEETPDFAKFYPNATLITGHDILFFWVARMILMGQYATGKEPFKETFLHGLIFGKSYWRTLEDGSISYVLYKERIAYEMGEEVPSDVTSKWEKMSKSKGNVTDPIEIIDEYGADAMRLALCSSVTHSRQIDLDRRKFEEFKNFANKLWNGARFILMNLEENEKISAPALTSEDLAEGIHPELFTIDDRWILSRYNRVLQEVSSAYAAYKFDAAAKKSYAFFWDEFCAYYLELCKPYLFGHIPKPPIRQNKQKLLAVLLVSCMRMLHPIAPFITEEIFYSVKKRFPFLPSKLPKEPYMRDFIHALQQDACMVSTFPEVISTRAIDETVEKEVLILNEIVYSIRNIRAEMNVPLGTKIDIYLVFDAKPIMQLVEDNQTFLKALVKVGAIYTSFEVVPELGVTSTAIAKGCKIFVPLPDSMKFEEKKRLSKELEQAEKQLENLQKKLSNQAFLEKAPKELVDETKNLLSELTDKQREIQSKLTLL